MIFPLRFGQKTGSEAVGAAEVLLAVRVEEVEERVGSTVALLLGNTGESVMPAVLLGTEGIVPLMGKVPLPN